jgi:hypothetical protein
LVLITRIKEAVFKEVEWDDVDQINLIKDRYKWWALVNTV